MTNPSEVTKEETQKTQADPETAERFIAEKRIGERIRRLRLKKSMGLVELGRHTGLSASFLSQLETGRVVPTLRNLARIAMVFSKDLSYFFESEPTAMFRIHKQKDRVRLPQTGVEPPTYFFESLGYMVPDRHMDPYFAEFIPLARRRSPRRICIPGFEFLYVLEGELELRHGDQECTLDAGRRGLLRRRHAALLPVRGQEAGQGNHRDHAPGAYGHCHARGERRCGIRSAPFAIKSGGLDEKPAGSL